MANSITAASRLNPPELSAGLPLVPAQRITRVFDRFYRIDESRSGRGTGLGLSICRWIVTAHEGEIEIFSSVGQGTTVRILLRERTTTSSTAERQPPFNSVRDSE